MSSEESTAAALTEQIDKLLVTQELKESSEDLPPEVHKQKYRYDWYQTESEVRINILAKKVKEENVHIDFKERSVEVRIVGNGDEFKLNLSLAHAINVHRSMTKVYGTKVELRMRKCEGLHWEVLEGKENEETTLKCPKDVMTSDERSTRDDEVLKYPSSSHHAKDWDKLVAEVKKEEKDEKPEGEAALNQLFQQIYHGGSDEVRKAMNKSFVESGGTVLSTNWGEIGTKKVEKQAPKGMEWKNYST